MKINIQLLVVMLIFEIFCSTCCIQVILYLTSHIYVRQKLKELVSLNSSLKNFSNHWNFRPSMMYGGNYDAFINYFLTVYRIPYRSAIYVYKKGEHTYKMPIWVIFLNFSSDKKHFKLLRLRYIFTIILMVIE